MVDLTTHATAVPSVQASKISRAQSHALLDAFLSQPDDLLLYDELVRVLHAKRCIECSTETRHLLHWLPDVMDKLECTTSPDRIWFERFDLLEAIVRDWREVNRSATRALLHAMVALARQTQDEIEASEHDRCRGRIQTFFRMLRAHMNLETRRIFIHGMMQAHQPQIGSSWVEDYTYWFSELGALFGSPSGHDPRTFSAHRKKHSSRRLPSPTNRVCWPDKFSWAGQHVYLVGGREDAQTRAELARVSQAEKLVWLTMDPQKTRLTQNLVRKIKQGSVDVLVILTDAIKHKVCHDLIKYAKLQGITLLRVKSMGSLGAIEREVLGLT